MNKDLLDDMTNEYYIHSSAGRNGISYLRSSTWSTHGRELGRYNYLESLSSSLFNLLDK